MKNKESSSYLFLSVILFLLQLTILSGIACFLFAVSGFKDFIAKGERGEINAMFIVILLSLAIAASILISIKIIVKRRQERKNPAL